MSDTIKPLTKKDGETKDLVATNVERLKELFPEIVTEGKVDFEALKEVLGDFSENSPERYSFNWNGKSQARKIAMTPSMGTLRPAPEESVNWDTTENLFIEGDNLEVLKLLQRSYHKKIKMIYIDPPYNTGNDFVYNDDFKDNLSNYLKITGQKDGEGNKITSNPETSGRYHTDWLNMMYPRLKLARELLREDGVIFISIDDNEVTNLKKICDEIFGEENFLSNVIWQHSVQPKGYQGKFSVHHNNLLVYQKSTEFKLSSLERTEEDNKSYSNPDKDPKGRWRSGDVRNALYRPNLIYDLETPSGKIISPPENGWRWSKETMRGKIETGEIVFSEDETRITRKIYLEDQDGRTPETIWFAKKVGSTRDGANELKKLFDDLNPFDTVKPTKLLKSIFEVANLEEGDVCLDFFGGSGSTADAIFRYTNSKFVIVQLPEKIDTSKPHGKDAKKIGLNTISEIALERIRRSIKSVEASDEASNLDLGFKVFKLDASNIKPWDASFDDVQLSLEDSIENVKADRSEEDVLYEILLKYGLDLTLPIKEKEIAGAKVFVGGAGALVLCLSANITTEVVEGIAQLNEELQPEFMRVVFRDSGFKDDVVKTNAVQILKQHGIEDMRSI